MDEHIFTELELREIFHLEFLRNFSRKVKPQQYALKGGVNLRFFFSSIRYSEDMDLDAAGIALTVLQDVVMAVLSRRSFLEGLRPFGIEEIVPPDMARAKQTETTQRFKVHLHTFAGEDIFTKIEFSRRGFKGNRVVETVSEAVLRFYRCAPVLVPHYDISAALVQKVNALVNRAAIQARDIFDIYLLLGQSAPIGPIVFPAKDIKQAQENILDISFLQFRDTVVNFLRPQDQDIYGNESVFDEIKLKLSNFFDEVKKRE